MQRRNGLGWFVAWLALGWVGCAGEHAHLPSVERPTDERAVALIEKRCSTCHETDRVYSSVGTAKEWGAVIHRMVYHHKGKLIARISDQEAAELVRWLSENQRPERGGVRIGYLPTGRPL